MRDHHRCTSRPSYIHPGFALSTVSHCFLPRESQIFVCFRFPAKGTKLPFDSIQASVIEKQNGGEGRACAVVGRVRFDLCVSAKIEFSVPNCAPTAEALTDFVVHQRMTWRKVFGLSVFIQRRRCSHLAECATQLTNTAPSTSRPDRR